MKGWGGLRVALHGTSEIGKGEDLLGGTTEAEAIKDLLMTFFHGLDCRDGAAIRRVWHPDAKLSLTNAVLHTESLSFLLNLPDMVDFEVQAIRQVDVCHLIATARVDYQMPIGNHSGFFTLVKSAGRWLIANWVDHGRPKQGGFSIQ